jgi:hypothetical protein
MRCWEVVPTALSLTGGRTSILVRRTYADGAAPPVITARTPRSCLSTARQDFLRIAQLGEPRTPSQVQEAYVKRVFVGEKIPPGRQPLWDRKNQSQARLPGRYRSVTLRNRQSHKLEPQCWALLNDLRQNSAKYPQCLPGAELERSLSEFQKGCIDSQKYLTIVGIRSLAIPRRLSCARWAARCCREASARAKLLICFS